MSLLFQTVWPEYQMQFAFLCNKLLQTQNINNQLSYATKVQFLEP